SMHRRSSLLRDSAPELLARAAPPAWTRAQTPERWRPARRQAQGTCQAPRHEHGVASGQDRTTAGSANQRSREECFECMREGERSQHPAVIKNPAKRGRYLCAEVDQLEVTMCRDKGIDDPFVLLGFAGACGVDEASTGCHGVGGSLKQGDLRTREARKVRLRSRPSDIGIPPDRAEP